MTYREAEAKLRTAGHEAMESHHLLYAVMLERVAPLSRRKGNRYHRVEETLRAAGVEPGVIVFDPILYGSERWIAEGSKH